MKPGTHARLIGYGRGYDDPDQVPVDRNKLGPQVMTYIATALRETHNDGFFGDRGRLLSELYDIDDIAEPTLLQMCRDNAYFYWQGRSALAWIYENKDYRQSHTGRDLWLARNGEDAFAKRGWEDAWDTLQAIAKRLGKQYLWVNDDNQVAIMTPNMLRKPW